MLKGVSFPVNHSAKLILGVLVLAVGVMAINNINQNSLNPNRNSIQAVLESFTPTEVDIGGKYKGEKVSEEEAIKQMEGLIAFNMLVAADCRLTVRVNKSLDTPRVAHFDGFEKISKQTDFNGDKFCAKNLDFNPADETIRKLSPFRAEVTGPSYDNEGRQGRTDFEINRTFELNKGETDNLDDETLIGYRHRDPNNEEFNKKRKAFPGFWNGARNAVFLPAGLSGDDSLGWDGGSSLTNFELQHDEIAQVSGEGWNDNNRNRAKYESGDKDKWKVGETPWGQGTDILEDDATEGFKNEVGGNPKPNWRLYSYRPRFENVPLIMSADPDYLDEPTEGSTGGQSGKVGEGEFEVFVEELRYKFCEGSKGYVQSNAQQMDSGGEASASVSYAENAVYPLIEITDNKFGDNPDECLPRRKSEQAFLAYSINGDTCEEPKRGGIINKVDGEVPLQTCKYAKIQNLRNNGMGLEKFTLDEPVYRLSYFLKECPDNSKIETEVGADRTSGFSEDEVTGDESYIQFNNLERTHSNVKQLKFSFTLKDSWYQNKPGKVLILTNNQIKKSGSRDLNKKVGQINGVNQNKVKYKLSDPSINAESAKSITYEDGIVDSEWTIRYDYGSDQIIIDPEANSDQFSYNLGNDLKRLQLRLIDKNGDVQTAGIDIQGKNFVRDINCG